MIPPTSLVFDRQRIVVAGEESLVVAFAIATLRRDGHCVTHAGDAQSSTSDFALRECHLFILGNGIGGDMVDELRERLPAVAILRLTGGAPLPAGQKARSGPEVATLREPFTAEELRDAVRPLLPQLRVGSILARRAGTPQHSEA